MHRVIKKSFSSVQSLSRVRLFATPWTAAHQASLSITNSQNLLKLRSIQSVMPSNHFMLCHPLLLLPSIFPRISVFSNQLALCNRWPKCWVCNNTHEYYLFPVLEFQLQHQSFQWIFRTDFLEDGLVDLLAVQQILQSLLQHHSSKTSIIWHSAFFIV